MAIASRKEGAEAGTLGTSSGVGEGEKSTPVGAWVFEKRSTSVTSENLQGQAVVEWVTGTLVSSVMRGESRPACLVEPASEQDLIVQVKAKRLSLHCCCQASFVLCRDQNGFARVVMLSSRTPQTDMLHLDDV